MAALIIPPWIVPEIEDMEPLDEASAQFAPQFAPGVTQRNSYGGLRPKFSRVHTVRLEEMSVLLSSLFDTDGEFNTVHTKVHRVRRGSFPSTELATNGTFVNGTTGWTSADPGDVSISVSDRTLRLFRVSAGLSTTVRMAAVTVTNAVYYVARVFVRQGRGALRFTVRLGTSAGGNEIAESATTTTQGMVELAGLASGTTMHLSIQDLVTTKNANDYCDIPYVSLARCALVAGGSQTGTAIELDQLPASTNGLLLPQDWVSISGELKQLVAPLNSNGSGQAYMRFKPQMFRSPADNLPVVITDPMGKFLVSKINDRNRFGLQSVTSYDIAHIYE